MNAEEIRGYFPALERVHNGHAVAYFDGPGGTQVPRAVANAMTDYLLHHNANTEWAYPTSAETDAMLAYAREAAADFLNASVQEIAFGANMTTLTFHLSRALGAELSKGDEIVVTELDHHANVDPWRRVAAERELCVRTVKMIPETGQLDWDDFARSLTGRTKIVAIGAASNALGTITDVRRAEEMAHAAGAKVFVDAVHFAPHNLVDVRELNCDFLACSAYKFYGPHVGILYAKQDFMEAIDFPRLRPAHQHAPEKAETGTLNHEGIVGAGAAIDFLASMGGSGKTRRDRLESFFNEAHSRGHELVNALWGTLSSMPGVTLYGPDPERRRTPTVSFTLAGRNSRNAAEHLAERGIFVSHGDFYAMTVVERLGRAKEGLVRAGCGIYTTMDEVSRLCEAVGSLAG